MVQHMPEGFTEMFARRLNESSALEVKEAQSGDLLLAGRALICPGNRHMKVRRMDHGDVAILVDQPRVNGHRPSVDVLFHSVATEFGDKALAVLMTGMGEDGAAGFGAIHSAGGFTIAQSPDTCIVDSMPRAAIERGFVSRVISLSGLASVLQSKCMPQVPPTEPDPVASSSGSTIRRRSFPKEITMKQFEALTRKDSQPVRYLIVDDSVFARKSLAKMIESFGGSLAGEAGDGCTAITEYARTKPDIVLMDITMPQMEGIEAVERIVQEHPEARVVMVSSVGYQDNILAALQKGARHFVQKPVKPDALYEIIRYVLNDDSVTAPVGGWGEFAMKMDLIQPFIGSLDTVLAEMMKAPAAIVDLAMEEDGYHRKGVAAVVTFKGQIEGRIVLDMDPQAAAKVASCLAGTEVDAAEPIVSEAVCELANMVIGNAVTQLNDRGFQFKVFPPSVLTEEQCAEAGQDSEATILCFETASGNVYLNVAMHYHARSVPQTGESRQTVA